MKLITKTFYLLISLFLCFFGGNSNNINNKRTLNNSIKKVNSSSKTLPELEILESKYDSDYVEFSLKYNIKISSLNFVEDNLKCNLIKYDGPFLYCEIIMVDDFFGNDISSVSYTKSINNYKNEYKYFNFINEDSCEAVENTVSTFLYMLYDSFGLEKYWNLSTIKQTYTLSKLVENLDKYVDYRFHTTYYLFRTHIVPSDIKKINQCNRQIPPAFSWIPNGSSIYPNNQFQIVFYDKDEKELYKTDYIKDLEIKSNYSTITYQLTEKEWNEALALIQKYDTVLVGAIGYQTGVKNSQLISGPYRSSMIEFYLYNL